MLKPEVAKERLKQWKLVDDSGFASLEEGTRFGSAIKRLPGRLSSIAFGLYGLDGKGKPRQEAHHHPDAMAAELEAARDFDLLSPKERGQILGAIFPRMAESVEHAWSTLKRAPYQTGWQIKAFRAPHHPEHSLGARKDWLKELFLIAEYYHNDLMHPVALASWAPYLTHHWRTWEKEIGLLAAATIDAGGSLGNQVFDVLDQSIRNEHEIGSMGRHVITGLLTSSRPEGWEIVEKTLLAAQRQEGLRQSILESIDLAHPEAYRRILKLIQEHDLARFSAVARAVNVWFGFAWDSASVKLINGLIEQVLTMLEDESRREQALSGSDPEAAFLALWAHAFEDAPGSIQSAAKLLQHKSAETRFVALTHLGHLNLAEAQAVRWTASDDDDLRVALRAIGLLTAPQEDADTTEEDETPRDDSFDRLERLMKRLPEKPVELKPIVWPWTGSKVSRQTISSTLVEALGKRPTTRLLPYLPSMGPWQRQRMIELFAEQKKWDPATREAVIGLAGDSSGDVRTAAIEALKKLTLTSDEIDRLLSILTRKASDLRTGIIGIVLRLPDDRVLECAQTLLESKDANQRLAGLEMLRLMVEQDRAADRCRKTAEAFQAQRTKRTKDEDRQLDAIVSAQSGAAALTLDNALGLMNPANRSTVTPPKSPGTKLISPAALACMKEIDDLIHQHREAPVVTNRRTNESQLLGTLTWGFPTPNQRKKPESEAANLPLREVWEEWYESRGKNTKDPDGMELVRADRWREFAMDWRYDDWVKWSKRQPYRKGMLAPLMTEKPIKLRYPQLVEEIIGWLLYLHRPARRNDFLIDAAETLCAGVPKQELEALIPEPNESDDDSDDDSPWFGDDWRGHGGLHTHWLDPLGWAGANVTDKQHLRLWRLYRWLDEPVPGARRCRPDDSILLKAYEAGLANLDDMADQLLGPRAKERYGSEGFSLLDEFTRRRLEPSYHRFLIAHPEVKALVEKACAIILETELNRGDTPTAATSPALCIGSLTGMDTLIRLMHALGKGGFRLVTGWREEIKKQRPQTLTHLAKVTYPGKEETPAEFAKRMRAEVEAKAFPEDRLIELAFLAPQWTRFVEAYFSWEGLSEGLYWFLAHMNFMWGSDVGEQAAESAGIQAEVAEEESEEADDDDADVAPKEPEKLSPWDRLIQERTALTSQDRTDGAIDVGWFQRVYAALGAERWERLAQSARFASNASQAKKAQLIADVLLGKAKLTDLIAGIEKKYLKEYVRLLGLYPLPEGSKRETELACRFKVLQDYGRYAKKLSGLTKPEALRALEIGLKNLASTAGYADAMRLDWALGASQWSTLRQGALSVSKDGVTVQLSLDDRAQPTITVSRGDKELKSAPPAVKKHPPVAELFELSREVKRQASRQKQALEGAMCRGDEFTSAELVQLCSHALVAPLLERLVFVGDGILGYPDKNGKALRTHAGKFEPIKKDERLRIAHPYDLFKAGDWDRWQRDCFASERVQPFKQIFRELYLITKQEKSPGIRSQRYAGHQVNPSQAYALWGHRGWNTGDGVFKVFHSDDLIASVNFQYGTSTPLEVEGLTVDSVSFARREDHKELKLTQVPPRLFSEVMRDVDLVVSVAHRGGVDPEASASTVEMRANLLRETCLLLGLKNVRIKQPQALIDGHLAQYTVHLGSGNVHRMPGGALCVVPVHAQHRGRLFLPFADDDPRTAEVVSKVLMFARDQEIQDPGILEQIRR